MDDERTAPVQGYSAGITWSMHLRAWDVYHSKGYYGQSAEDIARRGGFGTQELDMFLPGWREEMIEVNILRARIIKLEAALITAREDAVRHFAEWLLCESILVDPPGSGRENPTKAAERYLAETGKGPK